VKAAELELKAEMAEIEKEKAAARERTAEDEKLLAEWNGKRDQARAGVNEDLLRQYERVAKFRGSGLAEVRDQKCMGCQVMLRPQTYNDVRGGQIVICESCQRVLYFDPATGVAVERPSLTAKRRVRPKTHVDKAWFYRAEYSGLGEVFFAFLNTDGSASRRVYDAQTGRKIGETQYQPGDFSAAFADDIKSGVRLHTTLDLQQLEEWAAELPMTELDELHADLKKALREAPVETPQTSEHPAAS
jgi:C4-type zinc ribbon domain